jgi:hypothetical protein
MLPILAYVFGGIFGIAFEDYARKKKQTHYKPIKQIVDYCGPTIPKKTVINDPKYKKRTKKAASPRIQARSTRKIATSKTLETMKKKNVVFLAYAQRDEQRVRSFYEKLKKAGINPWMAKIDLIPGQNWKEEIRKIIRTADVFVAFLSNYSVSKSGFVQRELRWALDVLAEKAPGKIYLIPARLESCTVPDLTVGTVNLRDIQWVDLFAPDGFDRLLLAIQKATRNAS